MIVKIAPRLVLSVVPLIVAATPVFSADDLPKRQNFDRYNGMLNKSPFAVASAVVVPAAAPNFAKDLYLANAAHMPGEDMLTVQSSSDKLLKEYLSTRGANEHGYAISSIEWSEQPGQTKATISKDGQFAKLSFNQALIASAPPGPVPPPTNTGFQQPAVPTPLPNAVPPMPKPAAVPLPGYPTPTPHVRGVIQRNPSVRPSVADQSGDQ